MIVRITVKDGSALFDLDRALQVKAVRVVDKFNNSISVVDGDCKMNRRAWDAFVDKDALVFRTGVPVDGNGVGTKVGNHRYNVARFVCPAIVAHGHLPGARVVVLHTPSVAAIVKFRRPRIKLWRAHADKVAST